jgi:hypothetical protein
MEFVQGITFHSSRGFRYLISSGYQPFDYSIEKYLADLSNVQSTATPIGKKFFFVYPKETPHGNMQVFGGGEIVRSMQSDRPVVVPYIQYFACKLSDSVKYTIDFDKFVQEHGISYQDMCINSQTEQPLTPPLLHIEEKPSNGNSLPSYTDLQEQCVANRGTKIKRYMPTLEEGLNLLNSLMNCPNTLRWSFSAILTPLDSEYPKMDIIIVYEQPPRPQAPTPQTNFTQILQLGNQDLILSQFVKYVASQKSMDLKTATSSVLDKQSLEELDEMLKKFVKEEFPKTAELTKNVETSFSKLRALFQELGRKPNPTPQELINLNRNLDDYELLLGKSWNDSSLSERCYLPDEDLYNSLANYSLDTLQKMLASIDINKISNARLRNAMDKKGQESKNFVVNYWRNEFAKLSPTLTGNNVKMPQLTVMSAEKCLQKGGGEQFVSVGVNIAAESFASVSFDKAVQYLKVFTDAISASTRLNNLDDKTRKDLFLRGVSSLQDLIPKLQEPLDKVDLEKLDDPIGSYYASERVLVTTVSSYLTALMECDKKQKQGEVLNESNYVKAIYPLRTLMDRANNKQDKSLDERKRRMQQKLNENKSSLDEEYKKLASSYKKKLLSGLTGGSIFVK